MNANEANKISKSKIEDKNSEISKKIDSIYYKIQSSANKGKFKISVAAYIIDNYPQIKDDLILRNFKVEISEDKNFYEINWI